MSLRCGAVKDCPSKIKIVFFGMLGTALGNDLMPSRVRDVDHPWGKPLN